MFGSGHCRAPPHRHHARGLDANLATHSTASGSGRAVRHPSSCAALLESSRSCASPGACCAASSHPAPLTPQPRASIWTSCTTGRQSNSGALERRDRVRHELPRSPVAAPDHVSGARSADRAGDHPADSFETGIRSCSGMPSSTGARASSSNTITRRRSRSCTGTSTRCASITAVATATGPRMHRRGIHQR
jgi:hypothetical protein